MPTLAVVMATFNGERWIDAQFASLASQTRLPERLIVSDDGSSDQTVKLALEFARKAPFEVVLLEGPRAGYAENFWHAARHANTDLIAWCDQDDFWHPSKLQVCEQQLVANRAQLVSHSAVVTGSTLVPTGHLFPDYPRTRVMDPLDGNPWWVAPGFTTLFSSELLHSIRWEDRPTFSSEEENWRLDHDDTISLIGFASVRRVWIPDALANYRQHERNAISAPRIHGLAKVRSALVANPTQYSNLAEFSKECRDFVAICNPRNLEAIHYFDMIAARCRRRARVHQAPSRSSAMHHLVRAIGNRDFRPKTRGGFGSFALARDVVTLGRSYSK